MDERFLSFSNDFALRQPKAGELAPVKPVSSNRQMSQMSESRVFIARNSILTDLFQISHVRSIRHMFIAVLIIFVIQVTINDIIENGRLNMDFELIFHCFGKLHIALFVWLIMQICTTVVVYMAFYYWTHHRLLYCNGAGGKTFSLRTYDAIGLVLYIIYIVLFLILPCREIVKHQLPVASSMIVLLEQVRDERVFTRTFPFFV